jgi:hypothetical protein
VVTLPFTLSVLRGGICHFLHCRCLPQRWNCSLYLQTGGRAIAQAVSRWLPSAATRVRARVWSWGICGGQWCPTGAGFLRVLRFPLPVFIPPIAPQSPSSIIWGWYNRSVVSAVPSELCLTPLRIKKIFRLEHLWFGNECICLFRGEGCCVVSERSLRRRYHQIVMWIIESSLESY